MNLSGLRFVLYYYIKIGAFVILKRRKDRENEGFLFAKRRAEKLDGTTKKNGTDGKEWGSDPL